MAARRALAGRLLLGATQRDSPAISSIAGTSLRGLQRPIASPLLGRAVVRTLSTSCAVHARILPPSVETYEAGQLFVHRLFAYKGIIICSFNTKVHERRGSDEAITNEMQYQVLIHRGDWPYIGFPVDLTSYLAEGAGLPGRGEKLMTTMNGIDCVSHADIIPFNGSERAPIDHDLFDRMFLPLEGTAREGSAVRYAIRPEIRNFYITSSRSWMAPVHVNRQITEGIEVQVTTFYLGTNISSGQLKHTWRYVIRLLNTTAHTAIVRERQLKIFSLNSMHQLNGHGVVGTQPELTPSRPAFQYSSTAELAQSKGGHMWGSFKMERENGAIFDVAIPMFTLDASQSEVAVQPTTVPSPPGPPSHHPPTGGGGGPPNAGGHPPIEPPQ